MGLNIKNKIYILIFSLIVIAIIAMLVISAKMANKDKTVAKYEVSTNSVVFNQDTNLVDTSTGGVIEKKWDDDYYFVSNNQQSSNLGKNTIIYEKATEVIKVYGGSYRVSDTGNVVINGELTEINELKRTSFYKISDRVYLIVSPEIYTEDRSVYANKYLIVYIDKQGNASVLNDMLNLKTINPMSLVFDKYTFDIANEKLIVDNVSIDLKLINGSTNEYDPNKNTKVAEYDDLKNLAGAYNKLVNDFNQYTKNNNLVVSANNQAIVTNNNYIIKQASKTASSTAAKKVENKTQIAKRVSLRGAIASTTYIDVTYIVTDPEEKYQAVYLLVTGYIDGSLTTEKIILDKYDTTYRITGLAPKNEYSISLGYIEVITDSSNNKDLSDNIEDVINVRTTKGNAKITLNKISSGEISFNFKMYEDYAFDDGKLVMYADNERIDSVNVDKAKALSSDGFNTKLKLGNEVSVYMIRLENTKFGGKEVDSGIYRKFTYENAK